MKQEMKLAEHSFFYSSADGLRLHIRFYDGDDRALPVVCLPGLTRNARDFEGLARHLANDPLHSRSVLVFDYRGRGRSAHDPNWRNYTVAIEAQDVLAGLDALGVSRAAFIGTSRGGLIMHLLAAMRPSLIAGAVLNDVGPALGTQGLAEIKSYFGSEAKPQSFSEAVQHQRTLHGGAFPALGKEDWQRLTRALYRPGELVLDFDLALLNGLAALNLSTPLPTLWDQFALLAQSPVLTLRGENSKLLTAEILAEMMTRHPAMEVETVVGQGHAPLLDTAGLPQRISRFVSALPLSG